MTCVESDRHAGRNIPRTTRPLQGLALAFLPETRSSRRVAQCSHGVAAAAKPALTSPAPQGAAVRLARWQGMARIIWSATDPITVDREPCRESQMPPVPPPVPTHELPSSRPARPSLGARLLGALLLLWSLGLVSCQSLFFL